MAEPLKNFFSRALVRRLASDILVVHPAFPGEDFVRDACRGLDKLELLARADQIAKALHKHLPRRYEDAIHVLLRSLGAEHTTDELEGVGMTPFFYMPHLMFVAEHGLDHFELSMRAQHELTRRFTAEFSIRKFLERFPERTLRALEPWTRDKNPHVRRLVSEGTRPRLPWAPRVKWLEESPERVVPLLDALKDDPTTLVRRSVANHLNDIAKANPDLACEIAERWLSGATPERRALVEHAMRWLVKKGNTRALTLLGFGGKPSVAVENARFSPRRVAIGGKTRVSFDLVSTKKGGAAQNLAVDLVVEFVKAKGKTSSKVFKLKEVVLGSGARVTIEKSVSLAVHTTRKPYPGKHAVGILVNGTPLPLGSFQLVP